MSFWFGTVTGGGLVGASLGWMGALAGRSHLFMWVCAALCVVVLSGRIMRVRWMPPGSPWRVPRAWRAWTPVAWAWSFGAVLGAGILTVIPVGAFYVLLSGTLATADPVASAMVMAVFGSGRTATMAWVTHCLGRPGAGDTEAHLNCLAALRKIDRVVVVAYIGTVAVTLGAVIRGLAAP